MDSVTKNYINHAMDGFNDINELMAIMKAAHWRICKLRQHYEADKKMQCAGCPFGGNGVHKCINMCDTFNDFFGEE